MKASHVAIVGGGLAAAGILAWYFLQQKQKNCPTHITQAECVANGCYWYDGACHGSPKPPPSCSDYTTESECAAGGCYWYDGSCHSTPKPKAAEIISISAS